MSYCRFHGGGVPVVCGECYDERCVEVKACDARATRFYTALTESRREVEAERVKNGDLMDRLRGTQNSWQAALTVLEEFRTQNEALRRQVEEQAAKLAALEAQYIDAGESCKAQLAAKDQEIEALKAEAERERADADAAIRRLHAAEEREKHLRDALAEVVAISDRKHDAWDRAKAMLSSPAAGTEDAKPLARECVLGSCQHPIHCQTPATQEEP